MLGLPLTTAADVWSCGCVLMELILGQVGRFLVPYYSDEHCESG
jgi:hypothetical protein